MLVLAAAIAAYAFASAILGARMYPPNLVESFQARPWGIIPHAFFGGIALIAGPFQFHRGWLRERARHRRLGQVYLAACFLSGAAGFYMALYSYGGLVTHLGFGALALAMVGSTAMAYRAILARRVATHREWMIVSYALIYAAVTLRIEIPLLMVATQGDFDFTYAVVSWLCWVPNLAVAVGYVLRSRPGVAADLPAYVG